MKRIAHVLAVATALLALSSNALAQGKGGGPNGPGQGPGAGPAAGHAGGGMGPGRLLVAPDGTALVVAVTPPATADATPKAELLAVNASGAVAWKYTLAAGAHDMVLAGSNVVVSIGGLSDGSVTPALVAVSLATGAESWKTPLDGAAGSLEAVGTRVLSIVRTPPASGTTTPGERKLVSVDATGKLLWSVALDQ